jgi:cytochrome c
VGINPKGRTSCLTAGHQDDLMNRKTSMICGVFTGALFVATAIAGTSPPPVDIRLNGDAVHGKALYQGCQACHSIDDNDLGPRHRGVVGRQAGSVADYSYSPALKNSGLTWNELMLDRWLMNPSALVPGTKMFFKIDDPQARADIIAYLKELR